MQDSGSYSGSCIWDSFYRGLLSVAGPALFPIYVIEIGVFVMAAGTLVMALKMGNDGRTVNSSLQN